MNSWEIIEKNICSDCRPGSVGHLSKLNIAANLYFELRYKIKDQKESDKSFNENVTVRQALLNREFLKEIGL